jgi:hypothetical protein
MGNICSTRDESDLREKKKSMTESQTTDNNTSMVT